DLLCSEGLAIEGNRFGSIANCQHWRDRSSIHRHLVSSVALVGYWRPRSRSITPRSTISRLPGDRLYWTLWRTPRIGGRAFFGLLAQLTQAAAPVGLVLVVRQATGSLALAGSVSAAFWIVAAMARPVQGRPIDLRGSRP